MSHGSTTTRAPSTPADRSFSRAIRSLPGSSFETDNLQIGDPAQLIGKLARIAVQDEAAAFLHIAAFHDLASHVTIQFRLWLTRKEARIACDADFPRGGAFDGGQAMDLALLGADDQAIAADGQTHSLSGHFRLPRFPAGLGLDAQDLVQPADHQGVARQNQGTAQWSGQVPCIAGALESPLFSQMPGHKTADFIDPAADPGPFLSVCFRDIPSQRGKLFSQGLPRLG